VLVGPGRRLTGSALVRLSLFRGPTRSAGGMSLRGLPSSSEKPEFQVSCEDTELFLDRVSQRSGSGSWATPWSAVVGDMGYGRLSMAEVGDMGYGGGRLLLLFAGGDSGGGTPVAPATGFLVTIFLV